MALPELCPVFPATLLGNRGNPVNREVMKPTALASAETTTPERLEETDRMQKLAAEAADRLEGSAAQDVIRWAAETFGDRICVTSSMTDAVIIHLASQVRPGIDVV